MKSIANRFSPRSVRKEPKAAVTDRRYRYAEVTAELAAGADEEALTLQVAFSSEFPVKRRANKWDVENGVAKRVGETYFEILSHEKGDADLTLLNNGGAVLDEHDEHLQLGKVNRAEISDDKVGRAVLEFDGTTELSKTRFKQMRKRSRPHISFGYTRKQYLGETDLGDGKTGKRFSWEADEISSVARPADPTVGSKRSGAEDAEECHCTKCGGAFDRAVLDADFRCKTCGPITRAKADDFRFTRKSAGDISFKDLRLAIETEARNDERFMQKKDGELCGYCYVEDIRQEDDKWFAVIYASNSKYYEVAFELDGNAVTLGEAVEGVMTSKFTALPKKNRSAGEPATVDSEELIARLETQPDDLTTDQRKRMKLLLDKNGGDGNGTLTADAEKNIRADEAQKTRASVEKETRASVRGSIRARNEAITKRADEFIKDHGKKQRGGMAETIRKVANEFLTRDHEDAGDKEVLAEFGQRCLEEIAKVKPEPYLLAEQASEAEYRRYSLGRAIRSAVQNAEKGQSKVGMPDGFEKEVHDDMLRRAREEFGTLGYDAAGFQVPCDAPTVPYHVRRNSSGRLVRDGLVVNTFGLGGALVPTQLVIPVIEPLRNRTVLDKIGVRYLGGLQGNIVIPRQTAVSAPQAIGEIGQLQASNPQFDQISLQPRRIGNTIPYSKQLLLQSSPDVEALIRDDNFAQIALKVDALGLNGSGANNEPTGIMQQGGILSVLFGGAASYSKIVNMETQVRASNIYEPGVYVSTSTARGVLRVAPETLTGSTIVSGSTAAIWKGAGDSETVNGRPAFDSQQIPGDKIIYVVGEHVIWGMWGGLDVVVDYMTLADKAQIKLTINTWNDFAVRHGQAICVSADSAAQ